ncbi:MAG: hypothetical protein KDA69_20395, partial [Planctomycetaceae bacterium]|nr:hypothetical protein [Planctomycetaceae bacterium]
MKRLVSFCAIVTAFLLFGVTVGSAAEFPGLGRTGDLVRIEFESIGLPKLSGNGARKQLVVTGVYSSGQRHDLTHDVQYSVDAQQVMAV